MKFKTIVSPNLQPSQYSKYKLVFVKLAKNVFSEKVYFSMKFKTIVSPNLQPSQYSKNGLYNQSSSQTRITQSAYSTLHEATVT